MSLTPWARNALTVTEQRLVTRAGIWVSAKSPRGPWIAWGPGFVKFGPEDTEANPERWRYDLHRAVNRAAGRELLKEGSK